MCSNVNIYAIYDLRVAIHRNDKFQLRKKIRVVFKFDKLINECHCALSKLTVLLQTLEEVNMQFYK